MPGAFGMRVLGTDPLAALDHVTLTPRVAGPTDGSQAGTGATVARGALDILAGRPSLDAIT